MEFNQIVDLEFYQMVVLATKLFAKSLTSAFSTQEPSLLLPQFEPSCLLEIYCPIAAGQNKPKSRPD